MSMQVEPVAELALMDVEEHMATAQLPVVDKTLVA